MKTLSNHIILFDNECPMCALYTKGFVKAGMLSTQGREAYQNIPARICSVVDRQRAANEIALVNTETGEVTYGIKSLFAIIQHAVPVLKLLFSFSPFVWLMSKIYAFVSYNRKVIIPVTMKPNTIQPSFKLHYRLLYLLVTWIITAFILTAYAHQLTPLVPLGGAYREYFICGGQIIFQALVISLYQKDKIWDYLGNMMTISFAGALLLLPAILMSHFFTLNAVFYLLYFLSVAGLMLLEHLRRSKILALGWIMSVTWVIYRFIVLGLIFIL